jgi:hypothetical protein
MFPVGTTFRKPSPETETVLPEPNGTGTKPSEKRLWKFCLFQCCVVSSSYFTDRPFGPLHFHFHFHLSHNFQDTANHGHSFVSATVAKARAFVEISDL